MLALMLNFGSGYARLGLFQMNKTVKTTSFFILLYSFILVLFISSYPCFAEDMNSPPVWQLPHSNVGIIVADAASGKILYQQESDHYFTPASNEKILTAVAALYGLGADFTFKTTVSLDPKKMSTHILNGNLYIKFNGDPSLTTQDLRTIFQQIKQQGIYKIHGNIVIDDASYKKPYYGFGWSHDDLNYDFSAPVQSIIVDENSFPIRINGSKTKGGKPIVSQSSTCQHFPVQNHLLMVSSEDAKDNCELDFNVDSSNHVTLDGCLAKGAIVSECLAIQDPFLYVENEIKTQKQFSLNGKIIRGNTPRNTKVIIVHQSKPLSKLLIRMMKKSDNLYANSLIKMLGEKYYQRGTFKLGIKAEKKILAEKTGIDPTQIDIYDGSGQSRYALATPEQFYHILYTVYHDEQIKNIFVNTLPITGVDGTLKGWKSPAVIVSRVNAKTGTMDGISSLSGYVKTKDQTDLIFSILINNVHGKIESAHLLEREILKALV